MRESKQKKSGSVLSGIFSAVCLAPWGAFGCLMLVFLSPAQGAHASSDFGSAACQRALAPRPFKVVIVNGSSSGNDLSPEFRFLAAQHGLNNLQIIHVQTAVPLPDALLVSFKPRDFDQHLVLTDAMIDRWTQIDQLPVALRSDVAIVMPGSELGVHVADRLKWLLNLPGNDILLTSARRNKKEMHQVIRHAGIASVRDFLSSDIAAILRWLRTPIAAGGNGGEYPVVLKPPAGAATVGVHICANEAEVRDAFKQLLGSFDVLDGRVQEVLVQNYLPGGPRGEFVVNTVSQNGVHTIFEIWNYVKREVLRPDGTKTRIYDYDELVDPADGRFESLVAYARQVLSALGVREGASHMEVMMVPDGRGGLTPVLIENNARLMGGHTFKLMRNVSGTSALDALLLNGLDRSAYQDQFQRTVGGSVSTNVEPVTIRPHKAARVIQLISPRSGVLESIDAAALAELQSLPSFVGGLDLPRPGARISETVDLVTSPGVFWLANPDPAVVKADYQKFRDEIEPKLFVLKSGER